MASTGKTQKVVGNSMASAIAAEYLPDRPQLHVPLPHRRRENAPLRELVPRIDLKRWLEPAGRGGIGPAEAIARVLALLHNSSHHGLLLVIAVGFE